MSRTREQILEAKDVAEAALITAKNTLAALNASKTATHQQKHHVAAVIQHQEKIIKKLEGELKKYDR